MLLSDHLVVTSLITIHHYAVDPLHRLAYARMFWSMSTHHLYILFLPYFNSSKTRVFRADGQVASEFSSFEGVKLSIFACNYFITSGIDAKNLILILELFFESWLIQKKAFL